ncbi:response regulator transcription factor [Nocardiopsis alba]|uniref:Response regulator n=2 Tax=Nocardiopsis alba TaxID=53437 RepID=A0A7K2ISG3_9ACTN|nr:response regulator transcription factor [Nocardiopsis alba]AFR08899.1 bacterial regulatory s, luxR family protein [Nocardiopsis alba ATCC BAA-2165]MYR32908.1 response regulator [Nocardiopsis alba]
MIRVLLADDQPLVRAGVRALVERDGDIEVVAEASDGRAALVELDRFRPDVLLLDLQMPVLDGLDVLRELERRRTDVSGRRHVDTRVVVLTTFGEDDNVFGALRSGAAGFLLKDAGPGELREAVRTVAAGEALLSPGVTRRVVERLVEVEPPPGADRRLEGITDREREVLALVGRGRSNQEIGAELHLSPATARTHVGRLLTKLGVRDRVGLVVVAYESGLIRPGS